LLLLTNTTVLGKTINMIHDQFITEKSVKILFSLYF